MFQLLGNMGSFWEKDAIFEKNTKFWKKKSYFIVEKQVRLNDYLKDLKNVVNGRIHHVDIRYLFYTRPQICRLELCL